MLALLIAAAFALHAHGSSVSPQTFSPNSTTAYRSGPAVTKAPTGNCPNNCSYRQPGALMITWSQVNVTATYTIETELHIVNKKNNSTRTETISNTEDFKNLPTPTNLNSDKTVTTSVVDYDGSTRIIAYPTVAWMDYRDNATWTGTLSSTISGTPTCLRAPTGAVAVYPSHPPLPQPAQTQGINTAEDPRGWTFVAVKDGSCRGASQLILDLFPDFGIYKDCKVWNSLCEAPAEALKAALFLTKTSTSTESDDAHTHIDAPASSTPSPGADADKTTPNDKVTPAAPPAKTPSREASQTEVTSAPGGFPGPAVPLVIPDAPKLASTLAAKSVSSPSPQAQSAPDVQQPASSQPPIVSDPPASLSTSIIITLSPAPTMASVTTPVAIPVPITSTDAEGTIRISTSTATAHPLTTTFTNAQGSLVSSTTVHLPAIILTTTNAAGAKILTTSSLNLPSPPAITIGSDTVTANSQTQYIVGSQTLTPGGVVTVGGTEVSLAAAGSDVVIGSSTEALAPHISAGLVGNGANGTGVQVFTGDADVRWGRGWSWVWSWRWVLVWMVGAAAVWS